ncbi:MAG: glycosyltransferase family 1 protein [Acetobacteraceae bacterium]|nr:glycosyltransferase family 1 protein [Acetobacteraceae bacterium]
MHIVNIMLGRGVGGIEQAFGDYSEGLAGRFHRVTAITDPFAAVNARLQEIGIETRSLVNLGEWDWFAAYRLRRLLRALRPDVVLTHGSRAFTMARRAIDGFCPLVGVAHNYNARIRHLAQADGVFAITNDLARHLAALGVPSDRIFHIPNMIRLGRFDLGSGPRRGARHSPPVIGTMGRFVPKKGFAVFIDALALLHQRGYVFRAVLGGTGAEEQRLRARARTVGLDPVLVFPGWITDKAAFFVGIDIFCLPSLHEPFGIVLLEAFAHGVPVVSTDSEGPRDFLVPNTDTLVVPVANAAALADALARLLDDPALASTLAANGFTKAQDVFAIERVSAQIEQALTETCRLN